MRFFQSRTQEGGVIGEGIGICRFADSCGLVLSSAELIAVLSGRLHFDAGALLNFAGVKRRVNVDERDGIRFHFAENREIVAEINFSARMHFASAIYWQASHSGSSMPHDGFAPLPTAAAPFLISPFGETAFNSPVCAVYFSGSEAPKERR